MINFVTYTKPLQHVKRDWTKTSAAATQQNGQNPGRSGHCRVYTSLAFLSSCSDLRADADFADQRSSGNKYHGSLTGLESSVGHA